MLFMSLYLVDIPNGNKHLLRSISNERREIFRSRDDELE